MPAEDAIRAFWRFWSESADGIARAIERGTVRAWAPSIGRAVSAIDPGLDWELGAGKKARHYFCLSSKGDPIKRVTAERWRALGPGDGDVFEFHAARPGGGFHRDAPLVFGAHTFASDAFRVRVEVDDVRARAHLVVWHPSYASAPEDLHATVAFIALDGALGEDDVERWIGAVEIAHDAPEDPIDLTALVALVDQLRVRTALGPRGTILQGTTASGAPVFVNALLQLKRVDHLLMDTHVEIELALRDPTADGLTTPGEADRLNAAEDALLEALGHDAVWVARETYEGHRVMHLHVAHAGPALPRIEAWTAALEWAHEIRARLDPEWTILTRW